MRLTTRPCRHRLLTALSVALLAVGAAGCGSDADTGADTGDGSTTTDASTGGPATIVAEDFSLSDLTVSPGEETVLRNDGSATHTATADDGSFDLGEVAGGETSDAVTAPTTPGDYAFHCEIHDSMTATLTVES